MESASSKPDALYPPARKAWFACIVLTTTCVLAFMDRSIISLFIIPIQRDVGLDDTQVSLLVGLAFGVFNTLFGFPVARWVDGGRRTLIASLGILVWSLGTVASGLTLRFSHLFLARVSVGAGEATLMPTSVSLLADYFPPARRGLAMGIFYSGTFVGGAAAFLVGGALWRALGDRVIALPLLGDVHSWQAILIGVGLVGFLVAPLLLLVPEPPRIDGERRMAKAGVPLKTVFAYYRRHAGALGGHHIGFCLVNFPLHAGTIWLPTLLVRVEGWTLAQAGLAFGLVMLIMGPAGSATSGLLADGLARRGRTDGKLIVAGLGAVLFAVSNGLIAFHPTPWMLWGGLAGFAFFGTFSLPMAPGALQELMPNAMRGQATAAYVGLINIVAGGLAGTSVALIADHVFHQPMMIGVAFGIVGLVTPLLGAAVLQATRRPFRVSVRDATSGGA